MSGKRILVVDDESAILDTFGSLSKRFGYEMEFYTSGQSALDAVAADPAAYGLVLTDVCMQGLGGLELVKSLRSLCPKLGVIFMTGDLTDEVRDAAEAFDNVVFLEKPFQLEKIFKETIPAMMR